MPQNLRLLPVNQISPVVFSLLLFIEASVRQSACIGPLLQDRRPYSNRSPMLAKPLTSFMTLVEIV
jgi:hypothetical protein